MTRSTPISMVNCRSPHPSGPKNFKILSLLGFSVDWSGIYSSSFQYGLNPVYYFSKILNSMYRGRTSPIISTRRFHNPGRGSHALHGRAFRGYNPGRRFHNPGRSFQKEELSRRSCSGPLPKHRVIRIRVRVSLPPPRFKLSSHPTPRTIHFGVGVCGSILAWEDMVPEKVCSFHY